MFRTINKQVRRTREWVFGALLSLLGKKPYDEIKIASITEEAGVARQSFYRNFESKDDIVCQYFLTLLDDYTDALTVRYGNIPICDFANTVTDETIRDVLTIFFETLLTRREDILRLRDASLSRMFYDAVRRYTQMLRTKSGAGGDYQISFQLGGIAELTIDWIDREMRETPREMGIILADMLRGNTGDTYPIIQAIIRCIKIYDEQNNTKEKSKNAGNEKCGNEKGTDEAVAF